MHTNLFSNHQTQLQQLISEYGITYLALFGSQSRGDYQYNSDVDLLVDYRQPLGLLKFARLKRLFSEMLNKDVDLVSKKGVSEYLKPYILQDVKVIYEGN